jgi:hypothetical protein
LILSATKSREIHASTLILSRVGIPLLRFHPHPSHRNAAENAAVNIPRMAVARSGTCLWTPRSVESALTMSAGTLWRALQENHAPKYRKAMPSCSCPRLERDFPRTPKKLCLGSISNGPLAIDFPWHSSRSIEEPRQSLRRAIEENRSLQEHCSMMIVQ